MPLWIHPRGHCDEVIALCQDAVAIRLTQPADEFEIKLGRKAIRLVPVGANEEE